MNVFLRPEKSMILDKSLPARYSPKDIFLYIESEVKGDTGLVQQPDKIVVRKKCSNDKTGFAMHGFKHSGRRLRCRLVGMVDIAIGNLKIQRAFNLFNRNALNRMRVNHGCPYITVAK